MRATAGTRRSNSRTGGSSAWDMQTDRATVSELFSASHSERGEDLIDAYLLLLCLVLFLWCYIL